MQTLAILWVQTGSHMTPKCISCIWIRCEGSMTADPQISGWLLLLTPLMTFCSAASAPIWLARWRHRYATGTADPILEQQCLNVTVVRGMKGKGITEEWYAAALLMCATHFHLRAPCGPETFLVSPSWPAVRPVCFLFSVWFCQITKFGPKERVKSHDCFLAIGSDIIAALASVQLYIQMTSWDLFLMKSGI